MKLSIASNGAWLNTDEHNDVHIYADKTHVEVAINDPTVYKGSGPCPLALSLENGKATLQVVKDKEPKFYNIPLDVVNIRLRQLLADLARDYAK